MEQHEQLVESSITILSRDGAGRTMSRFLNHNYEKAICLKQKFRLIESKEWDSLTVVSELTVQIGHIFNFFIKDDEVSETNRQFKNIGDELSDVLLQLTYLTYLEGFGMVTSDIEKYRGFTYCNIVSLPILLGQLHESLLEKNKYRFDKPREGFKSLDDFIKDRIIKIYLIVFNFAESNHIDLDEEFDKMNKDANSFILRKINSGTA